MQNKLLNGSEKEDKKQTKGGNSHRGRPRGPEFFLFTMLAVIFFTVLLWSYEPHLSSSLLSIQDQLLLPTSGAVQEVAKPDDESVQKQIHERAQTGAGAEELLVNLETLKPVAETFPGSSMTQGPSVSKSSYSTEKSLVKDSADKDLKSFSDNKGTAIYESYSFKGSPTASIQDTITTEVPSITERSSNNEGPSKIEKEITSSSSSFKKTEKENKPKLETNNAGNTVPVGEVSFESKGSPTIQGTPAVEGPTASKASSTAEGSLAKEKEYKDSTYPIEKKEPEGTEGLAPKGSVEAQGTPTTEGPSIANDSSTNKGYSTKEEKDSTPISDKKEKMATESSPVNEFSAVQNSNSEGPSVSSGSFTTEWSSAKASEEKTPSLANEKTDQAAQESFTSKETVTTQGSSSAIEGPVAVPNDSSSTKRSATNEKEDKNTSFVYEKKEDDSAKEALSVHTKIEEKSKAAEEVENTKAVTEDSVGSKGSSTAQDSSSPAVEASSSTATHQWSPPKQNEYRRSSTSNNQRKGSSPTKSSPTAEWSQNDSTSNSQEKAKGSSISTETPSPTQGSTTTTTTEWSQNESTSNSQQKRSPPNKGSSPSTETLPPTKDSTTTEWSQNDLASNFQEKGSSANQDSSTSSETLISTSSETPISTRGSPTTNEWSQNDSGSNSLQKGCNYGKGRWVWDEKRPLYNGAKCKRWLSWMWACRTTTRPDFRFELFKWQPEECDVPDFDRHAFLKRMKDKTIAFVGDSIGRQQFQSMMCMLTGGEDDVPVEDVSYLYNIQNTYIHPRGGFHVPRNGAFRFPATNTTVLYYWSSCLCNLVPLNASDPKSPVAMHLDQPPSFLVRYLPKFDVLILNTGHHWNRGKFRVNRWVVHVNGSPVSKFSNMAAAKNRSIVSITKWVDSQLTRHPGLKVFFRTISPRHFFNGEWNTGGVCENMNPMMRGSEVKDEESKDEYVANAVKGTRLKMLDITALSELRDEAHISKYGGKPGQRTIDCLHWCLPGIPDTWNEILAAQI